MSIEKYTTEGLILGKYIQGENDMTFKVWTVSFGIIFVFAKSIRKISSKLRMKMQVGKLVRLTVVHGREIWRLTGVEEIETIPTQKPFCSFLILEAVNRFLPADKPYKKLFQRLKEISSLDPSTSSTSSEQAGSGQAPSTGSGQALAKNNLRALIYFIVLVETGYADAKIIGAKDLTEYINFSIQDLYIHFILNQKDLKKHLQKVLAESML